MTRSYSIVISTLNRAALLGKAITAARQLRWPEIEIVVVNGPSTDDTEAVVAGFPDVKQRRCPEANLSMSRNIGIAVARGDIVAFLDDDAMPEPTWIERLNGEYDDPRVGGVGGYILDHTGVRYQCRATVCDRFGDSQGFDSLEAATAAQDGGRTRYLSQTGANATYRRAALLAIGGFDETFAYFLDETDVNLRLIEAGWQVRLAPGALVHHKYAPSAERDHRRVPKTLYAPARSKAYFAIRHTRGRAPLERALDHLAGYARTLTWHNNNLLREGLIDAGQFTRLENDVRRGLRDGAARALSVFEPQTLSHATLARFASEEFQPIRPPLPVRERLRIAFATREYPPGPVGGIAAWTETLARQLAADGHEVSVITQGQASPTVDFENGVWVHRIVPAYAPRRADPPLPDLPQTVKDYAYAVYDEVMRIDRIRGLDLLSWPIWDLEGLAVHTSARLPTILSLHTSYALALPHKPDWQEHREYRKNHVDKMIAAERWVLQSMPYLYANSRAVMADMEAAYGFALDREGVFFVPHGLARAKAPQKKPAPAMGPERVKLLYLGRLEKRKGVDVLLEALPACLDADPRLAVDLVGAAVPEEKGADVASAFQKKHAGRAWMSRIAFHGALPRAEVEAHLAACDILVAPSRYESFGLVLLEAMKYAKPCISTRVGGIREVVDDGKSGILVSPGDASALRDAILTLAGDAEARARMGAAGLRRYEVEFTSELQAKRAADVYSEIRCGRPADGRGGRRRGNAGRADYIHTGAPF